MRGAVLFAGCKPEVAAGPDGRIIGVGVRARAAAGRGAEVVRLRGASWPGLIDGHIHLEELAERHLTLDLTGTPVHAGGDVDRDGPRIGSVGRLCEPRGVAFERFTPEGPMALLPEGDHYGLVWTTTPEQGAVLVAMPDNEFLAALATRFGARVGGFSKSDDRRTFPLALEFAGAVVGARTVLLGNAAQALHPVAGQGFNLGVRDAYELAQALLGTPRDRLGSADSLAAYARRRLGDRWAGIALTHGLLNVFDGDATLLRWPRGLALTLLDALPPLKRIFTHAMLYGIH
jgi:2-polyprenyl-6-methoxyphenol hydroxylase-like FAD-dependent oxidoreductase